METIIDKDLEFLSGCRHAELSIILKHSYKR